jgi:hypothetical protein
LPSFQGSDFVIELPEGAADVSTYAFAFPARRDFRPSIVIKTDALAAPVDLSAHVQEQLAKLSASLPNVNVVRSGPTRHDKYPSHASLFDWGPDSRRIRQKQYFLLLKDPARVVTITGTGLRDDFAPVELLFDAIFLSFRPTITHGKTI